MNRSNWRSGFLDRINYRGPLTPTAETLRQLHLAHLVAVPFENLSIHLGEPITLDDAALYDKIIRRRRGGFCYELNGLFAALLRELGFNVAMLSGEVMNEAGEFGPEFDHMTLMVLLEERWLADVGFGDSFPEPVLLDERAEQTQGDRTYRIDSHGDRLIVRRRDGTGPWSSQYRFGLKPYGYADYAEMCRYHQISPESHFTQRRICSRATPEGRITLSERRLITTTRGQQHELELPDDAAFAAALRDHFGMVLEG